MSETIRIGKKSRGAYVSACLYAFNHDHNHVVLSALGGQVSKAFDVADSVTQIVDDVNNAETEQFEKNELLGVKIMLRKDGSR